VLALAGCQVAPPADHLELTPASFAELPGWAAEAHAAALPGLLRSCQAEAKRPPEQLLAPGIPTHRGDLAAPCDAAAALPPGDDAAARAFFETWFQPHAVSNNGAVEGLFTGYYEPELDGARSAGARFRVPLYRLPPELAQPVKPAGYWTRAEIDSGVLAGRGLELAWLVDPVDAFFLHVQGSGRIRLASGGTMRVGYAGQNGQPYASLGAELIKDGALAREDVSMQSIRAWLAANPTVAAAMMQRNPSYVFFRELTGLDPLDGPLGAEGVALAPGRSLAVDRRFLPLGLPVWLDAPSVRGLLLIQDTGGAIRGPVRGDVFWGTGAAAGDIAGRMKDRGRYWLLVPRSGLSY
jgi:membrane-bound lytic murein transglycosylase A